MGSEMCIRDRLVRELGEQYFAVVQIDNSYVL